MLAHAPMGGRLQVLDVPSGEGDLAALLAAAGMNVTALDDAPVMPFRFDPAQRRVHDCNRGLPFEAATFDALVSVDGIEMLENPTGFLREAARVLRPGGLLVLAVRNVDSLRSRKYALLRGHPRYFGPDTRLAKEFGRRHPVDMMFMHEACGALGLEWVEVAANRVSGKTWWSERLRHRLQRHLPPYMREAVPFYGEMVIYAVRKPSGAPATQGAAR
jgi:SAM-dependent methyltransferase